MRVGISLNREALTALLTEVGAELQRKGISGRLFVVGGAAMALAYNARRMTSDVDGVFAPKQEVYEAARRVASRHPGLDPDWINDGAKGMVPPSAQNGARVVFQTPGIQVIVPSPYTLLAMKALSARIDRDQDDMRYLARLVGAHTSDDVLDIVERYAQGIPFTAKAQFFVQQAFPSRREPPRTAPQCRGTTKAGRRCLLREGHLGYHRGVL